MMLTYIFGYIYVIGSGVELINLLYDPYFIKVGRKKH